MNDLHNDAGLVDDFEFSVDAITRVREALEATIVGQENLIAELLMGVFAGGHVLLEGPPGLGKTILTKALARTLGFDLARIQCTPDLMPADITGTEILVDGQRLEFRKGPLFSNFVLVDEINRATPRTQAAFLESMQEHQVTYLGEKKLLPSPFWVLATQNPIELEGTYPLPEAQLDRFLLKATVDYPSADTLFKLSQIALDRAPADEIEVVLTTTEVDRLLAQVRQTMIADPVRRAAVDLIVGTIPTHEGAFEIARQHIRYGASPRGLQALLKAARVNAMLNKRAHVSLEDLRRVALPALRHRVLLNFESEVAGHGVDSLLEELISLWMEQVRSQPR